MIQDKRKKLSEERLPPYVSYRQWQKLLADLREFMPSKLDARYFHDLRISGSSRSMLRGALRFLGLTSLDGTPKDRLKELVNSDAETRPRVLEDIVREAYAPLFAQMDLAHASRSQIKAYFESEDLTGDIGRKCWSFLRAIATDARIQLSPRVDGSNHGKKLDKTKLEDMPRHRAVRTIPTDMAWETALLEKFPSLDPQWPDDVKKKWFDDFRELSHLDTAMTRRGSRPKKT